MNGIVQPDKEAEKAFRKMLKDSVKKDGGKTDSYVDATYKRLDDLFKDTDSILEKMNNDTLKTY